MARYRIAVFGQPRSPWRLTIDEALEDAIALELACWDEREREWFLAVPVDLITGKAEEVRSAKRPGTREAGPSQVLQSDACHPSGRKAYHMGAAPSCQPEFSYRV